MENQIFLNKTFKLKIETKENQLLFYNNAKILSFDDKLIVFLDSKTNRVVSFSIDQIKEIQELGASR